ncbi:hypothetical protein [Chitinophaga barathri]|uniref:hypothetical protein n=1 Tax=Chitinophaga barathri TaxID=1647451 RepID=UPI001C84CFD2|nr:hypothetical protein [Chitinophaga barathri]
MRSITLKTGKRKTTWPDSYVQEVIREVFAMKIPKKEAEAALAWMRVLPKKKKSAKR